MPTSAEWLPLGTAFVLGLLHALEVDHMVAVTTFVSTRPAVRAAAAFGLKWGLGHSLAVALAGGVLLATGVRWSSRYETMGEAMVGLLLIGLGIWAVRVSRRLHLHPAEQHGDHAHVHTHPSAGSTHAHAHPGVAETRHHSHRHGITLVGMAHGLAGTTAVVALVPVTLVDRFSAGMAYLGAFALGTILAMATFAMLVARAMELAAVRSMAVGQRMGAWTGAVGIGVGIWWVVRALARG